MSNPALNGRACALQGSLVRPSGFLAGLRLLTGSFSGGEQGPAYVCDVDDPDESALADDRQVPEMASDHSVRRVPDACRRLDEAQLRGHQVMDPDLIRVSAVRHQLDDVCLRDEAYGLAGLAVQDHESGRTRAPHQVSGRSHMIVRYHRRYRRAHDVRDGGRGGHRRGRLGRSSFCHDLLRFRDLAEIPWGTAAMLHAMTDVSRAVFP